jgi:hypothetical protein
MDLNVKSEDYWVLYKKWTRWKCCFNVANRARGGDVRAKWWSGKRAKSYCCSCKQVNFGLEISMNDTHYLISSQIYRSELIHCADIHLCHSDLFPNSQNWTAGHRTYVRSKLNIIGHFVRRPCKRYFKACRTEPHYNWSNKFSCSFTSPCF